MKDTEEIGAGGTLPHELGVIVLKKFKEYLVTHLFSQVLEETGASPPRPGT